MTVCPEKNTSVKNIQRIDQITMSQSSGNVG